MKSSRDRMTSSMFVRSITYILLGTLFLLNSTLPMVGQEQPPARTDGRTAVPLRSYVEGSSLDRAVKGAAHTLARAPQGGGGVSKAADHTARNDALGGLAFVGFGAVLVAYGESQSCVKNQDCGAGKYFGLVAVCIGAALLGLAARYSSEHAASNRSSAQAAATPVGYPAEAQEAQEQINQI